MASFNKAGEGINMITSVIKNNVFKPFQRGIAYATSDRNSKSFERLARHMYGSNGKGLMDFQMGGRSYSGAKVAGSLMGAAVGARFLSGGGIYRDSSGNTDIAGIPFF